MSCREYKKSDQFRLKKMADRNSKQRNVRQSINW